MSDESPLRIQLILKNKQGLHARAAAVFVRALSGLSAEVLVSWQNRAVNGRSMLDLMTLGAPYGSVLEVQINGADANTALAALMKVVDDCFDEE
jgi:phosphocarrier protein HPr